MRRSIGIALGTLQKEIRQASLDGYTLIALAKKGGHIAILERGVR